MKTEVVLTLTLLTFPVGMVKADVVTFEAGVTLPPTEVVQPTEPELEVPTDEPPQEEPQPPEEAPADAL